jgi:membrane-bound metal-dependent hydrolase YbcI (DUF457 family)
MFVGHYAGAFVASGLDKRLSLGAAFVCAQLVDYGWDVFVLTGIEHARIVPGLPSNPLDLYHMPYSHSLVATFVWSAVAALLVFLVRRSVKLAAVVAFAVASHWFLDLIVHRQDLPLAGDATTKLGAGLWNQPVLALVVELAVLFAAAAFYVRRAGANARWIAGLLALLAAIQLFTIYGPLPPSLPAMCATILVVYTVLALAARWVERKASHGP